MIADLEALLSPLGAEAFFAEHYEKRYLHLTPPPAIAAARTSLLSHAELLSAVAREGSPPDGLVIFPEQVGRTAAELVHDPSLLQAYLDAGHPLVWNRARGLSPAVDALTAMLAETFGAHVWPNVYATGTAGTPFDVHFDAHEVIALQCEGEKDWSISEVRVDRPLDATEMEAAVRAALRVRRDEAAARTLATFTARPGDLVYVPRGQFHNASTARDSAGTNAGRSLHVTFGIELPSPFDLAKRAVIDLLGDPLLREYLPPRALDPDGSRSAELLREASSRVRSALGAEGLRSAAEELRATWTSVRPRPGGRRS